MLEPLFDIGIMSQEFNKSPQIRWFYKDAVLIFDYETEGGAYQDTGLRFIDALAFKVTREIVVEIWMIQAYNTISIVKDSAWLTEMLATHPTFAEIGYHHYVVYFDSYGCYEFIARDVSKGLPDNLFTG